MRARTRVLGCWLSSVAVACGTTDNPTPSDSSAPITSGGDPSTALPPVSHSAGPTTSGPTTPIPTATEPTSSSETPVETSGAESTDSALGSSPSTTDDGSGGYVDEGKRELLSQTGLYLDIATETLGPNVREFTPQFALWTDSAEKRRWIHIPEGTQIDTSYMDEWQFPVGTKLWKEFVRDGVRIETRLIEKLPPERAQEGFQGWLYMTYVWNEEQTDAAANTEGLVDAKGTPHDVPTQEQCGDCHDMRREKPLGFSAIQLSHDDTPTNLDGLFADGWITVKPEAPLVVPGTEEEKQLLGYFHANCGHCHREGAPVNNRVGTLQLWLETSKLASVQETNTFAALVDAYTESGQGSMFSYRVVPGDPDNSELMRRLLFRAEGDIAAPPVGEDGEEIQVPMPPLGTEVVDDPAVERVRAWILSLPTAL